MDDFLVDLIIGHVLSSQAIRLGDRHTKAHWCPFFLLRLLCCIIISLSIPLASESFLGLAVWRFGFTSCLLYYTLVLSLTTDERWQKSTTAGWIRLLLLQNWGRFLVFDHMGILYIYCSKNKKGIMNNVFLTALLVMNMSLDYTAIAIESRDSLKEPHFCYLAGRISPSPRKRTSHGPCTFSFVNSQYTSPWAWPFKSVFFTVAPLSVTCDGK